MTLTARLRIHRAVFLGERGGEVGVLREVMVHSWKLREGASARGALHSPRLPVDVRRLQQAGLIVVMQRLDRDAGQPGKVADAEHGHLSSGREGCTLTLPESQAPLAGAAGR